MNTLKMNESLHNSKIDKFNSTGYKVGSIKFPEFTGVRVMMMPFFAHDVDGSIPDSLSHYKQLIKEMISSAPGNVKYWDSNTAYLTIDEKQLTANECQRKEGLHVDGMYDNMLAGAWGGSGGGWGSCGNGMLLASNTDDLCKMWTGEVIGHPINDGDCEHLRNQLYNLDEFTFKAGDVVWADGYAYIKASLQQKIATDNLSVYLYQTTALGLKGIQRIHWESNLLVKQSKFGGFNDRQG